MSDASYIQEILASTRKAAQQAQLDMDVVSNALAALHPDVVPPKSIFELWAALDEQIGKASASQMQQLASLRDHFVDEMIATEGTRLERVFKESAEAGWKALLTSLAEATAVFRHTYCRRLCKLEFALPETGKQTLKKLQQAFECIDQSRWPEAYAEIEYLAGQDFLSELTRARLLAILGQIQHFHFQKTTAAKELLDAAEKLAPEDARVLGAMADYWVAEKDIEQAKSYCERAIHNAPSLANAYTTMGDYFESGGNLTAAEERFLMAIASASGDGFGYSKLFKLYGRQELFTKHGAEMEPIMERLLAICPEYTYQTYLDFGFVHDQNGRSDKAQEWYQRAIALDETRPAGHVMVAQSYERQSKDPKQRNDVAWRAYHKAVEVAPEYPDAYWGLAWLCEQQEDWQGALEWYERIPPQRIEVAGRLARAKVGEMYSKLGDKARAEEILKQELRADNDNAAAKNVLNTIGDEYYQHSNDREAALRIYGEILEILGKPYKGYYHNRLGNLNYYYGEYEAAAVEYELATNAASNPDFHRNLALAHRELKRYEQAARQLVMAAKLDTDNKSFNREMSLLRNAEANDLYAQGDYPGAIDLYTKAIGFDESNDVIHSNLAGAWEHLTKPGRRLEALDKAIKEFEIAQRLKPTDKYGRSIERLNSAKEFVRSYGEKAIDKLHVVTPIVVEVAGNLIPFTEGTVEDALADELATHLASMKTRIQDKFGVSLPGVRFRGNEGDLPDGSYIISLMEIPVVMGTIATDRRFFAGPAEAIASLRISGTTGTDPITGAEGRWINPDDWPKVEAKGLELWDVIEYPIRHLEAVLQRNLADFVGHQEIAGLLEGESPTTLAEMRASRGRLSAFTSVCKGLVAEGVPLKPFSDICKLFSESYAEGANLQDIVESIRSLPAVRPKLPGNESRYSILPLGKGFEAVIRNAIYGVDIHAVLALEPELCQDALSVFGNAVEPERALVAVVESAELRPFVRLLIELEFPGIPVLSRRELRLDLDLKTLGAVEMDRPPKTGKTDFRSPIKIATSQGNLQSRRERTLESNQIGISVVVNQAMIAERSAADEQPLQEMFSLMQDGLFYELGIVIPEVRLEIDSSLSANQFRFRINGRDCSPVGGLQHSEVLVGEGMSRLSLFGINGLPVVNPANDTPATIVQEEKTLLATCKEAGLTTWGPAGFLVLTLSAEIRKSAATFQTLMSTQYILDALRPLYPELMDAALDRFSVEQFRSLFKDLLEEEISIRDLRTILESMLSINGTTDVDEDRYIVFIPHAENPCSVSPNAQNLSALSGVPTVKDITPADYSRFVRTSLKRYISHKYSRGASSLMVYLLDREIERRIGDEGTQPLTAEETVELKEAVRAEVGEAHNPVVLTTMGVRRRLKKLIEDDLPKVVVLAYQELSPEMSVQLVSRISWQIASSTSQTT